MLRWLRVRLLAMSIELSSSSLPPLPSTLSQTPASDAASEVNVDVIKTPSGEQATRLHSRMPLVVNKTDSGWVSTTLHSKASLMVGSAVRVESSGIGNQASVANLNLLPTVMTSLHAAATNTLQRTNNLSAQRKVDLDQGLLNQDFRSERSKSKKKNKQEPVDDSNNHHPIEDLVEPYQVAQHEVLFAEVFEALVRGEQSDMIRQLQRNRRIVVVFPALMSGELTCEAQVYMLWRDAIGIECIAYFSSQLRWATRSCSENWLTVRGYKDRAANNHWHLRVQPIHPSRYSVSFQMGTAPSLPGVWKDVWINIPGAPRFWLTLASQFSVQIALSMAPLSWWSKQ